MDKKHRGISATLGIYALVYSLAFLALYLANPSKFLGEKHTPAILVVSECQGHGEGHVHE